MGRYGEIWGDMGRYGEIWASVSNRIGLLVAGSSELASRWVMHFVSRLEGGSAATDETRVPPRTVGAPPPSLRIGRLDSLHHAR